MGERCLPKLNVENAEPDLRLTASRIAQREDSRKMHTVVAP